MFGSRLRFFALHFSKHYTTRSVVYLLRVLISLIKIILIGIMVQSLHAHLSFIGMVELLF